jgi:hypothetical protein
MAVLKMLSEMICAKKLLGLVAFTKLVNMIQVLRSSIPICRIGKFFAAKTTDISRSWTGG